jgi:hypothetical protein
MMVAVIVLMLVGVALSAMIGRLLAYLLRWQQHNMVEQANSRTKYAHCRGLRTGVSSNQIAIAHIVRRRRELLLMCGLLIATEEPP